MKFVDDDDDDDDDDVLKLLQWSPSINIISFPEVFRYYLDTVYCAVAHRDSVGRHNRKSPNVEYLWMLNKIVFQSNADHTQQILILRLSQWRH